MTAAVREMTSAQLTRISSGRGKSQRHIPMLLGWVFVALGFEHFEGVD